MPLSDLAVFSEYAYSSLTEVLDQQVDKFNEASGGTIMLSAAAHQGDFSDLVKFAAVPNLVRRRNAYGSGVITPKNMSNIIDTKVKVAAGTPPIEMDPSQFKWIQQDPKVAGAAMGMQLAKQTLADMLNTSVACAAVALGQITTNIYDARALPADSAGHVKNKPSFINLNSTAALFGDSSAQIAGWVMHSGAWHALMANQLANVERLFTYGTVGVIRDPAGVLFVMSDIPSLFTAAVTGGSPVPAYYTTLGLVPAAISVEQNSDFTDNWSTLNGDENISRTYQAEWSFELGLKGFSWNKSSKSPTDAALLTAANWDQYATYTKDLLGVEMLTA